MRELGHKANARDGLKTNLELILEGMVVVKGTFSEKVKSGCLIPPNQRFKNG